MTDKEIRLPDGLDVETATDVLREYARHEEAQIVESDMLQSLRDEITEAKETFAAVLAEESPQSAETLSRQDMDALTEPFRDDDGDIDVDTLRQTPQTGDVGGGDGSGSGSGSGFSPEQVSLSQKQELETLERKRTVMENRGMENRASEIEQEMVNLVGAEDYETLEAEVL